MRIRLLGLWACLCITVSGTEAEEGNKEPDYRKRIGIEAKIAVKKNSANMSINDVRQQISGYFSLQDDASIYDSPIGGLKGKYWVIGQTVGGWSTGGTGKYVVFQKGDWAADLPLKGTAQVPIKETSTTYDKTGSGKFGFEYYGYLFVVQNASDEYLIVKSNRKEFEDGGSRFLQLEENMTFDKDLSPKARASWYN